jgi:hypothetical protein
LGAPSLECTETKAQTTKIQENYSALKIKKVCWVMDIIHKATYEEMTSEQHENKLSAPYFLLGANFKFIYSQTWMVFVAFKKMGCCIKKNLQ